jgi:LysM repeat protein
MNGLQDLIAKLQKIEEAAQEQAQYDINTQILTYNGKQYKWNPQGQATGKGTVVSAPSMAVGSRSMGPTNVELNADGTYTKTSAAAPNTAATPASATAAGPETMDQVVDRREKAAAAKQILKTMVKKKRDLDMVNGFYIEAETGALLHSMIANRSMGGQPAGTVVTTRDIGFGQGKEFADQLTGIGLKITPETVTNPGIFGWKWTESTKTILKINLKDLETIALGKPPTNATPTAAVPASDAQAAPAASAPAASAPAAANPEIQKKIDRVKAILGLNNTSSGFTAKDQKASTATSPVPAPVSDNVPVPGNLAEGIRFKSRIGRLLAEEFDVLEADVGMTPATPTPKQELDTLWAELTKLMATPGALTPEQRKEIEGLTQMVADFGKNTTTTATNTAPASSVSAAVQSLATANNIKDPNKINVGQKIKLPDGSEYTVVQGDTLSAIQAGKYKGTPPTPPSGIAPGQNDGKTQAPGKVGRKNPGTMAFQNWINANGGNVKVDGQYGDNTSQAMNSLETAKPKEFGTGGGTRRAEMMDMLAVGTAYNVKPGGGTSLDSPRYLELMKKYGYDPKTGQKIGGSGSGQKVDTQGSNTNIGINVPPASASNTANAANSSTPTAGKLATDKDGKPTELPEVLKTYVPSKPDTVLWIGGYEFEYKRTFTRGGSSAKWECITWPGKLVTYNTRLKVDNKYTSPGWEPFAANMKLASAQTTKESVGFANEELNRIVSLVHHR